MPCSPCFATIPITLESLRPTARIAGVKSINRTSSVPKASTSTGLSRDSHVALGVAGILLIFIYAISSFAYGKTLKGLQEQLREEQENTRRSKLEQDFRIAELELLSVSAAGEFENRFVAVTD